MVVGLLVGGLVVAALAGGMAAVTALDQAGLAREPWTRATAVGDAGRPPFGRVRVRLGAEGRQVVVGHPARLGTPRLQGGERVRVRHDPDDPSRFLVAGERPWDGVFAGTALAVAGVVLAARSAGRLRWLRLVGAALVRARRHEGEEVLARVRGNRASVWERADTLNRRPLVEMRLFASRGRRTRRAAPARLVSSTSGVAIVVVDGEWLLPAARPRAVRRSATRRGRGERRVR